MKNCPRNSLRSLVFYARFARSRFKYLHLISYFSKVSFIKDCFSESLGATFLCVARRHSLKTIVNRHILRF